MRVILLWAKSLINIIFIVLLFYIFLNNSYAYIYIFIIFTYFTSFFICCILQFKYYNYKNHFILKIFYILILMFPFFIEKFIEKLIRLKYRINTPIIIKILNEEKIKFHAVFGTFLFMIRNNNFGDNDIDFAIWKNEWNEKEILFKLTKRGFVLKEKYFFNNELNELCFNHKKYNISMDIFIIDKNKSNGIGFDEKNHRYCIRPTNYSYSLKKYKVQGVEIYGPNMASEYLTWMYGKWEKPDENYHWFYGPSIFKNKIVNSNNIKKITYK